MYHIVMQVNYEYNDEIYYEAGLYNPIKVFSSKEEASMYCEKLNLEKHKSIEYEYYCYSSDEIGIDDSYDNPCDLTYDELSDGDKKRVLDYLPFFKVVSCE